MSAEPGLETIVDFDELLVELTSSFASAARELDTIMAGEAWRESPLIYRIPQAQLTVRVALSYSNRKIKGLFARREASEKTDVLSTVTISLVAVPREELSPGESRRRRTS